MNADVYSNWGTSHLIYEYETCILLHDRMILATHDADSAGPRSDSIVFVEILHRLDCSYQFPCKHDSGKPIRDVRQMSILLGHHASWCFLLILLILPTPFLLRVRNTGGPIWSLQVAVGSR